MAREFLVSWVGKPHRDAWETLQADYRQRIQHYQPLRELVVKPKSGLEGAERLAAEANALLAGLPQPCYLVALDRRGETLDSLAVARRLAELKTSWPHPVAFVLGSDLGLGPALLAAARWRWSLGPLTLPHELARLVLYEQLYRALSIEAGIKYHRPPL